MVVLQGLAEWVSVSEPVERRGGWGGGRRVGAEDVSLRNGQAFGRRCTATRLKPGQGPGSEWTQAEP